MDTRYVLTGALLAIALVAPVASSANSSTSFVAVQGSAMACANATDSGFSWGVGLNDGCVLWGSTPGTYALTVRDTDGNDVPFDYAQSGDDGEPCGLSGSRLGPQVLTFTETCERVSVLVSGPTVTTGTIQLTRIG